MNTKDKPKSQPSPAGENAVAQKPVAVAKGSTSQGGANKSVSNKAGAASDASQAKAAKQPKKDKPRKIKMVRDSFTMPESDYAKLAEMKRKCLEAGVHVKKSELLRAGLLSLSRLNDASLLKEVGLVEIIKTGRPAKV